MLSHPALKGKPEYYITYLKKYLLILRRIIVISAAFTVLFYLTLQVDAVLASQVWGAFTGNSHGIIAVAGFALALIASFSLLRVTIKAWDIDNKLA